MPLPLVQCEKCGSPASPDRAECAKCAGRVVRVCGACEARNSLAKRFCDSCGAALDGVVPKPMDGTHAAPPDKLIFESIAESAANEVEELERRKAGLPPDPAEGERKRDDRPAIRIDAPPAAAPPPRRDLGLPHTAVGRAVRPQAEPKRPQPAPQPPRRAEPPPARASAPAAPSPKAPPPENTTRRARAAAIAASPAGKFSTALALVLLLAGGALWTARRRHMERADVQVPIAARRYLAALKAEDFQTAYAMLTADSRGACPLDEFKKVADGSAPQYSDVSLVSIERDTAYVRYRLAARDREPEERVLVFQKEDGGWRRVFVWNLLRDAESALDRSDPAQALSLSKTALSVSPRDPIAQTYLCEALYSLHDPARGPDIEKACGAALELSRQAPPALALNAANLFHIRAILGDTLKNALGRYQDASEQYTGLLMSPNVGPGAQCELLLGRAECRLALRDYTAAVEDLSRAAGLCEAPTDLDYAKRTAAVYLGTAQKEAIELAQQYHLEAGGPTVLEWRRQARDELARKFKARGRGAPPPENWQAQHLGGSQYRADVRAGTAVLFSARVDLQSKTVRMETQ